MTGGFRRSTAVIIGVERYAYGIPCLSTPVNDATQLAALLEAEHKYTPILLTEGVTKARLNRLFCEELPADMEPGDRLLIYFAGHGVALDGLERPEGYLLLQDSHADDPATYLNMAELYDWLKALPCRHLLLILDCCFAGAMRWSSMRDLRPRRQVLYRERFERFTRYPARRIITSTAHDQKALDVIGGQIIGDRPDLLVDGHRHSPFALALFQALGGAADLGPGGRDGAITATELYLYLRETVEPRVAIDAHHEQTPGLWSISWYDEQDRPHPTDKGEYIFLTPGFDECKLPLALPLILENNPYRGLEPYAEKHSGLFFGRAAVVMQLIEQVKVQPFTLVLGPSGIGKSSLVQAGLIPELRKVGGSTILPPLRPADQPYTSLCQLLTTHLSAAAGTPTEATPAEVVGNWLIAHPDQQLVLVIDQLEELITLCRKGQEAEAFVQLLTELLEAHCARLRVVLTLRNDFEPAFDRRWFVRWWSEGRFIVPAMGANELRGVIEEPALARVLHFEPPALVDDLIGEVIDSPGALPLLSFTLSELYRLCVTSPSDDRALTRDDYLRLGGVFGALRHRAEAVYRGLQDEAHRETMRHLMERMVAFEGGELARRRVFTSELTYPDDEKNQRVEIILAQLTEARLVVGGAVELNGAQLRYIEPAHDALVRAWVQINGGQGRIEEELLFQRQVTQAAASWGREADVRRKRGLLWNDNPGLQLLQNQLLPGETAGLVRRGVLTRVRQTLWPPTTGTVGPAWLNTIETDFVRTSIVRRRDRWRQLVAWVTLAFTAVTVAAVIALFQRNEALFQRNEAQKQEQEALHQLAISESQRLSQVAQDLLGNQPEQALLLSYEAGARGDNPISNQALWDSLDQVPLGSTIYGDGVNRVESAELSPDGNYLLLMPASNTASANSVILWDIVNQHSTTLTVDANSVSSARFSPNGQQIVTTDSGWVRTWDLQGRQLEAFKPFATRFVQYRDALVGPGDDSIFALDMDGGAHILRSGQPAPVTSLSGHAGWIWALEISSDNQHLLTSGRDGIAKLWNREGQLLATLNPGGDGAWAEYSPWKAVFSPDGQRALTPAEDGVARLWDLSGQVLVRFEGYTSPLHSAIFSPDGLLVLTASNDGKARLWDLSGKELLALSSDQPVGAAIFSPDGKYILTTSDKLLQLWTIDGRQILTLRGHSEAVQNASFSHGGDRIVSVGDDGLARLWELDALPLVVLDQAEAYTFSPDRRLALATGRDGGPALLSLTGGAPITLTHPISEAVFSADGGYLLSSVAIVQPGRRRPPHARFQLHTMSPHSCGKMLSSNHPLPAARTHYDDSTGASVRPLRA